ncbi:MAG: metal-dependent hydrolase, partial [Pirellulales bacterium]|nr:metal-dependent hydrolase [Pirellulales bacterium]
AMLGINGAAALGLHRRHGWQIVALAGFSAALPDWDGLTIILGANCYAAAHRVCGHNLLVAGLLGAVTGWLCYRFDFFTKIQQAAARKWPLFATAEPDLASGQHSPRESLVWIAVGLIAAYSHLLADLLFSAGDSLPVWHIPLFWPFSHAGFACPMVPWGDVGTTVIFALGMIFMARRPRYIQSTAICTLLLVALYIMLRGSLRFS